MEISFIKKYGLIYYNNVEQLFSIAFFIKHLVSDILVDINNQKPDALKKNKMKTLSKTLS